MKQYNRGQALVEFVLLLPILVFLLFGLIDFGRITYTKNYLESKTSDALMYLENDYTFDGTVKALNAKSKGNPIKLSLMYGNDGYVTITLTENLRLLTPGLNLILKDPYPVKVERVIKNEK